MKKNITIIVLIFLIILGFRHAVLQEESGIQNDFTAKNINYVGEGIATEEIIVTDKKDRPVFSISIEEFNEWTKEIWHLFDEDPEVGEREVVPGSFGFFDRTAKISPNHEKMVFSVHDYAIATTVSFLTVVDLESGKMNMIDPSARGEMGEVFWSPESDYISYGLSTARSGGEFVSVDDVNNLEKLITVSGNDVLEIMDPNENFAEFNRFMPRFRGLNWTDNYNLQFVSDSAQEDALPVIWNLNIEEKSLEIVND